MSYLKTQYRAKKNYKFVEVPYPFYTGKKSSSEPRGRSNNSQSHGYPMTLAIAFREFLFS